MGLSNKVAIIHYVREHTTVPVPQLYAWYLGYDNVLRGPYMLREHMPGKPFPFPFSQRGIICERELRMIHAQLVKYTAQLSHLTVAKIGQLREGDDGGSWSCSKPCTC